MRAVLLCNAQLTKAESSMYNGSRSDINNHEVSVEFNCFPVRGRLVDKAAKKLLQDITGVTTNTTNNNQYAVNKMLGNTESVEQGATTSNGNNAAYLDSTDYRYGIMGNDTRRKDINGKDSSDNPSQIKSLKTAIDS